MSDESSSQPERVADIWGNWWDRAPFGALPDLDALLDACDAIAITSETLNHVELAERAAAKGCHILVEKPLAMTMEGCDRI